MSHSIENVKLFEKREDWEIIQHVLQGEKALYEIVIRRYNQFLYKLARGYGYGHHDAEDLMQETYISAYKHLGSFENRSSFKTWLARIMLNHCYQKKQKFSFQKEIALETKLSERSTPMFQNNEGADKTVLKKEFGHILENALMQLSEDYRMVFTARELNELNVAETAEALNISENNVKVRLNRAKKMLRTELEKMYSPQEIFEFNLVYCDKMVANVMHALDQLPK